MRTLTPQSPVVIFAGGQGTRLKQETEFRPKPLVEVGGRPILWHIMKIFGHYGFRRFVLLLGYRGAMIKDWFVNRDWMSNDFTLDTRSGARELHTRQAIEDWSITFVDTGVDTNTGGRLLRARPYLGQRPFLATYGDGLADVDLGALVALHARGTSVATLTGVHPTSTYGVLDVGSDHQVRGFREKPALDGWINAGFFCFQPEIFDYLDPDAVLEQGPIRRLVSEGQLAVHLHGGYWKSMDTFKDALALNAAWERGDAPWAVWRDE